MLSITIKSKSLEFYAEIKDRVCVLVGDSGIGKTTMYNILRRRKQPPDRSQYCNRWARDRQ